MAEAAYFETSQDASDRALRLWLGDVAPARAARATRAQVHISSASGLVIEADALVAIGDWLDIHFSATAKTGARVLWVNKPFFGCQFESGPLPAPGKDPDEELPPENMLRRQADAPLVNDSGETLGMRLRMLRAERKLTQDDVAASLGISIAAVSYWEADHSRPKRIRLFDLAALFDVPAQDLTSFYIKEDPDAAAKREVAEWLSSNKLEIASRLGVEPDQVKIMIET